MSEKNFKVGTFISISKDTDIMAEFKKARDLDLDCCQIKIWGVDAGVYTPEVAQQLMNASKETDIEITALWAGWSGPCQWGMRGMHTIGLVPVMTRYSRLNELKIAGDFAQSIGVTDIITHIGWIPDNPMHPDYIGTVGALKNLAAYLKAKGMWFLFETGQETPTTLLRMIEDIGTGNLGINFDTANLLINGRGNSLDAVEQFGQFVRNTHCKDALLPTGGYIGGEEVPLGKGKANIPEIIRKLIVDFDYKGPFVVEREIGGPEQIKDIAMARDYIRSIVADVLENK